MIITKTAPTEIKTGECYGAIVNPLDYTVIKKFRNGVAPVEMEPKNMSEGQKNVLVNFISEFFEEDVEVSKEDFVTAIDADFIEKTEEETKPVEVTK